MDDEMTIDEINRIIKMMSEGHEIIDRSRDGVEAIIKELQTDKMLSALMEANLMAMSEEVGNAIISRSNPFKTAEEIQKSLSLGMVSAISLWIAYHEWKAPKPPIEEWPVLLGLDDLTDGDKEFLYGNN